jgi:hydroxypyruvate isomerase
MPTRRDFLSLSLGAAALGRVPLSRPFVRRRLGIPPLRQSVCRWPFGGIDLDEFCRMVKFLGFGAVDLVDRRDWATVKGHGLLVSTANTSSRRRFIQDGLNDPANHDAILTELATTVRAAGAEGIPNVIAMFGNRVEGIDDERAMANCALGLAQVAPLAEQAGVTIVLEMLNSRVDHREFQGDHTDFGVEVCRRVGSSRVRLLYDIYHMQIMEGDVIRTIRDNHQWFAHYHTAGNPGRNDLDDTQELQYGAIAAAIAATGFTGWVAHEFIAKDDPARALEQAREVMGAEV